MKKKAKRPPAPVAPTIPPWNVPEKWRLPVLILVLALSLLLAGHNRFVQDDAFISFIYARNLARGQGLTWFGTRIQGYTNFLWVLFLAVGFKLGVNPINWSYLGGLISFAVTLYATWKMSSLIFKNYLPAVLTIILLAANYSVSSFATGGLETMAQTALFSLAMYFLLEIRAAPAPKASSLGLLSGLAAAAVLTRPDSVLPCGIMGLFAIHDLYRKKYSARKYLSLLLPGPVLVGAWAAGACSYYGRLFPNTYYAKIGPNLSFNTNGLIFLLRFFHWYWLWPFFLMGFAVLIFKRAKPNGRAGSLPLLAAAICWLAYIVYIGGDFMEFRFLVPIAPFLFLLLAGLIYFELGESLVKRPLLVSAISMVLLGLASFHHARHFKKMTPDMTLDSIDALATFYGHYPDHDWKKIAEPLGAELAGTGAIIAVHAAGAIPFYSDLTTVDMWGLNDAEVAGHGSPSPPDYRRPGHRRHATLAYLQERQVNLIIGDPTLIRGSIQDPRLADQLQVWARHVAIAHNREPIGEITLVAMPLPTGEALLMWYLTPTEKIARVIADHRWPTARVRVPDL